MHLIMILTGLSLAFSIRGLSGLKFGSKTPSWPKTLGLFVFPPLLLLTTAIAIVSMGPRGQMLFPWDGWVSYGCAISFLGISGFWCLTLFLQGQRTLNTIRSYPTMSNEHHGWGSHSKMRVVDMPLLYSAQVGFWEPELVVSQGLLDTLPPNHLNAVLIHEHAHYHYRDTFWFFWLGWFRQISGWLPQTECLWQELLILRELRADRWASERTDALLIAEALLHVVQTQPLLAETFCAFGNTDSPSRLAQRIDSLLSVTPPIPETNTAWLLAWLVVALTPFMAIPFHH